MNRLRASLSARASPVAIALLGRLGCEAAAEHRVIDALAGSRRDDARGVAGQHDIAAVVPPRQRLQRNGSAFAAERAHVRKAGLGAQRRTEPLSEKPLWALPVPTLIVGPCGKIQA